MQSQSWIREEVNQDEPAAGFLLGSKLLTKPPMWRPAGIYNYLVTSNGPEVIIAMGWLLLASTHKRLKLHFPMKKSNQIK